MDFLFLLHPISILGVSSIFIGVVLMGFLRYSHIGYGETSFKGSAQKTKTWSSQSIFARGLIIIGIILFAAGFTFRKEEPNPYEVKEKEWYGPWSTTFYGDSQIEGIVSAKFDHYTHKVDGSHQFYALLYDDEGRKVAEMYQLKEGRNDFQNVKGTFKMGGQAWIVEISLLSDKESFAGVLRKKSSVEKVLWFGKKK